jgi:hypothetical protein
MATGASLAPWYTYPRIDNFGMQDPAGPFWKPDSNVQVPGYYPITALLPGTVTSVQWTGFGQEVVTVKLDSPLNALATHTFYEHMSSASVNVGQHLNAGDLLGHNNPGGQVPLGFGLYSGDVYGSGSAWSVLQNDLCPGCANLLNPVKLLDAAKSGAPLPTGTGTVTGSTVGFDPLAPLTNLLKQLGGLWAWLSNPLRLVKMTVGIMLIVLALYLLIVPEESNKVIQFVKAHPEVLAA